MGGFIIKSENTASNIKVINTKSNDENQEKSTIQEDEKNKHLGLTQANRDDNNFNTIKCMNQSYEGNKKLFSEIKDKVVKNYNITVALYIISFAFGLALLTISILAPYFGLIPIQNSIVGGAASLIELLLVLVFKPIEKIHEIISDFSQITIITSSYQEQVGLRLVQMTVKDRDSLGIAAQEINQAATNSVDLIQKYCEAKAAPEQNNMMDEIIKKIQEFFKKKDKDTTNKK